MPWDKYLDHLGDNDEEDTDGMICTYCGAKNLRWQDHYDKAGNLGRPLFTPKGRLHVCAIPDDFEVVIE
jgi:hypothetical protein